MIDEIKTLNDFGYVSSELSKYSHKQVWRICIKCGEKKLICYYAYRHLCAKCSQQHIRGPFNIEYFNQLINTINENYINEIKTFNDFGYYSIDLAHSSTKKVWRICQKCHQEKLIPYRQRTNLCIRCSQLNKKRSIETKNKISKVQRGKYISHETRKRISAALRNISYNEWESFAKENLYCPLFNESCREANREKYGRKCFICGCDESENVTSTGIQRKLSVHHVDMNKQQGCNNYEWKLIPVCMHCHNLVHSPRMIACITYILN